MARRGQKRLLTEEQERIVRQAAARGVTWREAAFLAGITPRLLQTRMEDQLADLRGGRGRNGRRCRPADPTPEEIAERRRECDERRWRLAGLKFTDRPDLD